MAQKDAKEQTGPKVKPRSYEGEKKEGDLHLQTPVSALPAGCLKALGSLAECHLEMDRKRKKETEMMLIKIKTNPKHKLKLCVRGVLLCHRSTIRAARLIAVSIMCCDGDRSALRVCVYERRQTKGPTLKAVAEVLMRHVGQSVSR